ncbi:RHS repeat-associated core domain-containing protein, partial [Thauera sinica]
FQYDAAGNLVCTTDANAQAGLQPKNSHGCTEFRQYDELNRVTRIVDALGGETAFTYDLAGHRLAVTDAANKTWAFAYDDLGRLAAETDHAGKSLAYKADEAGNVYEKTNRLAEVTRYSFDTGNRLTRVDYLKDGSAETFAYDAAGNRSAAANGAVSYTFQYDVLNRPTAKLDSRGRSLSFTYDAAGNLLTKTTYQGSTTHYVYNAANRLVMLRNPDYTQVDYQYDPAGRMLSRVTANGARSTYQYEANGTLTRETQYDAANTLVSDTTYTRDRVGHILTRTDGAGTTTYAYDALYRLKTADYPGATNDEAFTYDAVGNRLTHTRGSLAPNANTRYYGYTAGTNRLLDIRVGGTGGTVESSFVHDHEGRLASQTGAGAKALTWDAKGRLKTAGAESYTYDPMDYRIGRSGGSLGSRSYFLEGEHLESVERGGELVERYFRGAGTDELVAGFLKDGEGKTKPYLFHHDALTNTTAVTGHNGGTIQHLAYGAFGNVLTNSGSSPNRLKYSGREDDGNGCYYYRARYYCLGIDRFISEDPLGFAAGDVNFYTYVGNNPVNANDPEGKFANLLVGGGISVAMGYGISMLTDQEYTWQDAARDAALGSVGAGLTSKAIQLYQARHIAAPLITKLTASSGSAAQAEITSGIYFLEQGGASYVGQSGQLSTRLATHVADATKPISSIDDAVRAAVSGSKTSREVAEQLTLNNMGGVNATGVLNVVNPIGSARSGLLNNPTLGNITSIATPAQSIWNPISAGSITGASANLYPSQPIAGIANGVYRK